MNRSELQTQLEHLKRFAPADSLKKLDFSKNKRYTELLGIADDMLAKNPNGLNDSATKALENVLREAERLAERNATTPAERTFDSDAHTRTNKKNPFKTSDDQVTLGGLMRAMVTGGRNDYEKRALSEGTDSAGGYTVPTSVSDTFFDALRPASTVLQSGAQMVMLDSDYNSVATVSADPTLYWRAENAAITPSDPTFSGTILQPKTLAAIVKVSRELLQDSLNIEPILETMLVGAFASELDAKALEGSGSGSTPTGLKSISGVNNVALSAALTSYSPLVNAYKAVLDANAVPNAVIMSPRDWATLANLADTTGQPLAAPAAIANLPWRVSSAIATNGGAGTDESTIYVGDFSRMIVGVRHALTVEVLRDTYAENGQYAFLAWARYDVAVSHADAFAKITAITD